MIVIASSGGDALVRFRVLFYALSLIVFSSLAQQPGGGTGLADLRSVTYTGGNLRCVRTEEHRAFSMGGKAYVQGFVTRQNGDITIAAVVPEGTDHFHADFGVADDGGRMRDRPFGKQAHFDLKVDGEVVRSGDLVDDATPTVVDVDLAGHRSVGVYLRNGAGIGDPVFVKGEAGTGKPKLKPVLVSPKSGISVTRETVRLKWQQVEGASAYGVSVVALKLSSAARADQKRLWSFTVSNSSFDLPIKDLPEGDYLWNVIAFGPREPLGAYSLERTLTVER